MAAEVFGCLSPLIAIGDNPGLLTAAKALDAKFEALITPRHAKSPTVQPTVEL